MDEQKGIVRWFNARKGYGFIRPESGEDIFLHITQWLGPAGSEPREGDQVTFGVGSGRGGKLEAKDVHLAAAAERWASPPPERRPSPSAEHSPQAGPTRARPEGESRFLNPYNFVRYLEPRPKDHVLGDCPPPPHDRYVGLSGRITCQVEAMTPLFVSDGHEVQLARVNGKEHKSYRFFEYNGQPAIPASSLRGAIRSVFEAVTNSCFAVFEQDEKDGQPDRLEHRLTRVAGLIPARVDKFTKDGAELELFDCSADSQQTGGPTGHRSAVKAGLVSAYKPRVLREEEHVLRPFTGYGLVTAGHHDGERVAALVETTPTQHRSGRAYYEFFRVVDIKPKEQYELLHEPPGQRKVCGYLHVTGPNIEKKHDERLFFSWDDRSAQEHKTYRPRLVTISKDVIDEYNRSLKKYWDSHQDRVNRLGSKPWPKTADDLPWPSWFIEENRELKPGDLVYYHTDPHGQSHISPVSMPRIPYRYPREALLPNHLHPCDGGEDLELCPACRVFGWVYGAHRKNKPLEQDKTTAYAGRVRFSHGTFPLGVVPERLPNTLLAILSKAKPTATLLYLLDDTGQPTARLTYDDARAKLRGRKHYRNWGVWKEMTPAEKQQFRREYEQAVETGQDGRTDQNRTARQPLAPGACFAFAIDFENLAKEELGALLWSLELEGKGYHRLGYAKPLGFGSVKVTVAQLETICAADRYQSLTVTGGWEDGLKKAADGRTLKDRCMQDFIEAMVSHYHKQFLSLPNLTDLLAILGQPPDMPIHYPRLEVDPQPKGEQFRWFMANKKGGQHTLDLAAEDKGLPLNPN